MIIIFLSLFNLQTWNPLTLMLSQLVVRLQIRTHSLVSKGQKVAEVFSNSLFSTKTYSVQQGKLMTNINSWK